MTRITLIDLSDWTASIAAIDDPFDVERLPVPLSADVSAIRALLFDAARHTEGFVVTFGGDDSAPGIALRWPAVAAQLRRAFGVLTGAASGLNAHGGGSITVLLPSSALIPASPPTADGVGLRAVLGMAEALRAELGRAPTRVGIVFHTDPAIDTDLATRLRHAVDQSPMYSLSPDLTANAIRAYFDPMLAAIDRATAGPPLPDIGPMAVVYDLAAIGPAPKT